MLKFVITEDEYNLIKLAIRYTLYDLNGLLSEESLESSLSISERFDKLQNTRELLKTQYLNQKE